MHKYTRPDLAELAGREVNGFVLAKKRPRDASTGGITNGLDSVRAHTHTQTHTHRERETDRERERRTERDTDR